MRIKNEIDKILDIRLYLTAKYTYRVNKRMIIFDLTASNGYAGSSYSLYYSMSRDSRFSLYSFVVIVESPKKYSHLKQNHNTIIVKEGTEKAYKYLSKSKYWILTSLKRRWLKPKNDQIIVLTWNYSNSFTIKISLKYIDYFILPHDYVTYLKYDTSVRTNSNVKLVVTDNFVNNGNFFDDIDKDQEIEILAVKKNRTINKNAKFLLIYESKKNETRLEVEKVACHFDEPYYILNLGSEVSKSLFRNDERNINLTKKDDLNKYLKICDCLISNDEKVISKFIPLNKEYFFINGSTMKKNAFSNIEIDVESTIYKRFVDEIIKPNIDIENSSFSFMDFDKKFLITEKKRNIIGFFRNLGFFLDRTSRGIYELKNTCKGKRVFLIGNGPSLKVEDLELLNNDLSFGCNNIHNIYSMTSWRPDYHFIVDSAFRKGYKEAFLENLNCPCIMSESLYPYLAPYIEESYGIFTTPTDRDYRYKHNCLAYRTPSGTVMTMMMEVAIYMGFDELYLLGVDATISFSNGHFYKNTSHEDELRNSVLKRIVRKVGTDQITEEEAELITYERTINAYKKIKAYADSKGIKIINAGRGGNLEVFPRVQLEKIFAKC